MSTTCVPYTVTTKTTNWLVRKGLPFVSCVGQLPVNWHKWEIMLFSNELLLRSERLSQFLANRGQTGNNLWRESFSR
jgi:hypothetical protein